MKKISKKNEEVYPEVIEISTSTENQVIESTNNESLTEAQKLEEERKFANWRMDGTAFVDFRFVDNIRYSQEIINGVRAVYDPDKLGLLKSQADQAPFLTEGKSQILSLCHADQALTVHSDLFRVQLQIKVGTILNIIEPTSRPLKNDMNSRIFSVGSCWCGIIGNSGAAKSNNKCSSSSSDVAGRGGSMILSRALRISFSSNRALCSASKIWYFLSNSSAFKAATLLSSFVYAVLRALIEIPFCKLRRGC